MAETARLAQEAKGELDEKLENVNESARNRIDDIENMPSRNIMHEKDNFNMDHYTALRGEISKYYGTRILQVSRDEDKENEKIFPSPERNRSIGKEEGFVKEKKFIKTENECDDYSRKLEENYTNRFTWRWGGNDEDNEKEQMFSSSEGNVSMEKEEGFIREKDVIKMEKECADYSTKLDENKKNRITFSWSGNIFSKLINFGDLALKYVPEPWRLENSDNYLSRLSKQLTG